MNDPISPHSHSPSRMLPCLPERAEPDSETAEIRIEMRCTSVLRVLLGVSAATLQSACANDAMTHISQDDLLARMHSAKPPSIVDVRTQREYDAGHVPGAIHIPFYAVLFQRSEIPSSAGEPVVVYCEHGPRAGVAKLALSAAGFEHVLYLEGHMSGWKQRGLPMEASQ